MELREPQLQWMKVKCKNKWGLIALEHLHNWSFQHHTVQNCAVWGCRTALWEKKGRAFLGLIWPSDACVDFTVWLLAIWWLCLSVGFCLLHSPWTCVFNRASRWAEGGWEVLLGGDRRGGAPNEAPCDKNRQSYPKADFESGAERASVLPIHAISKLVSCYLGFPWL